MIVAAASWGRVLVCIFRESAQLRTKKQSLVIENILDSITEHQQIP